MRDFELTYAAYAEFQRGMERYWCLRWLLQSGAAASGRVVRESSLRSEAFPWSYGCPRCLESPRRGGDAGGRGVDLLEAEVRLRYVGAAPELTANDGSDALLADGRDGAGE